MLPFDPCNGFFNVRVVSPLQEISGPGRFYQIAKHVPVEGLCNGLPLFLRVGLALQRAKKCVPGLNKVNIDAHILKQ